eukprot:GEMP01072883.1.p1 GENE.GEMP01072883.1~~GEMP01072883.1.p1  ORF type:complete len:257 (+),score=71.91 GEMP01072883.1:134-904(+)
MMWRLMCSFVMGAVMRTEPPSEQVSVIQHEEGAPDVPDTTNAHAQAMAVEVRDDGSTSTQETARDTTATQDTRDISAHVQMKEETPSTTCSKNEDCTVKDKALCDTATSKCSPCKKHADCSHLRDTAMCTAGRCHGCTQNTECEDFKKSLCGEESKECEKCVTNMHCSHHKKAKTCKLGECQECDEHDKNCVTPTKITCVTEDDCQHLPERLACVDIPGSDEKECATIQHGETEEHMQGKGTADVVAHVLFLVLFM